MDKLVRAAEARRTRPDGISLARIKPDKISNRLPRRFLKGRI
jgi:hypothetical protein